MKKIPTLLLTFILALSFCACGFQNSGIMEPVEFYYQQIPPDENTMIPVIASEPREASGHTGDLTYLLSLYLRGPLDSELKAPFPTGCKLVSVVREGDTLIVTLDSTITTLENIDRTIACACLAKTCFSLTDAAQIRIKALATDNADTLDVTIGHDSLLLEDTGATRAADESQ